MFMLLSFFVSTTMPLKPLSLIRRLEPAPIINKFNSLGLLFKKLLKDIKSSAMNKISALPPTPNQVNLANS